MADAKDAASTPQSVTFHYIKSQQFRAIHVDGAVGGITPRGLLHVALYSERTAIPQMMVHKFDESGNLGPPTEIVSKPGIVREVEVDLLLDRETLASLQTWLSDKLKELDKLIAAAGRNRNDS